MSYQILTKILEKLNPKERDVILRRYGVKGKQETLESIANDYNISRERLRQIQRKAEEKVLPFIQENKEVNELIKIAKSYLEPIGVKKESTLFNILKKEENFKDEDCKSFRFLANFHPEIIFHYNDYYFHNFYAKDEKTYSILRNTLKKIHHYFFKKRKVHFENEILNIANQEIKNYIKENVNSHHLFDFITILKHLAKNPFGLWGHHQHPYISGKTLKDKIYLILKIENKPLHFSEIYEKLKILTDIEDELIHPFWRKTYSIDSVKNELIKHSDFVLVKRGVYGLKEWGLIEGTAKELILKILKEKKKIKIEELWSKISNLKNIKKTSFLIYIKQLGIKKEQNILIYND